MKINIIATLSILTRLNRIYLKDLPEDLNFTERQNDFTLIRDAVTSFIISSGNLLNGITPIPAQLEPYIERLEELNEIGEGT